MCPLPGRRAAPHTGRTRDIHGAVAVAARDGGGGKHANKAAWVWRAGGTPRQDLANVSTDAGHTETVTD